MACEDTQKLECARPAAAAAAAEEVVVVVNAPESSDMAQVEKPADEKGQLSSLEPGPDAAEEGKPNASASAAATTTEEEKITEKKMTTEFTSFKEEPNVADELPEVQKKALHELKQLIREALSNHQFSITTPITPPPPKGGEEKQLSPVNEGEKKAEGKEEKKEPIKTAEAVEEPPAVAVVVEEVVVDTVAVAETVDEDGTKTVEAIKETIVEVVSSVEQTPPPATTAAENDKQEAEPTAEPEEVSIWGIPLVADDERSDVVLLKFLRARDFRVKDAFNMIKNTVRWRKEFGIDSAVLEEEEDDLGTSFGNVVFMHGWDKQGHPVCYNVYGAFHNDKELYEKAFGDEETKKRFLKWRIQFLEKSIRKLDMSPHGVSTLVQVVDLRNSPGLLNRELRLTTGQALQVLQDNYPEFVAKQVFINVPWWYLAYNRMISPFLTQRTKSKFVFAGPSRTAETLFKYIAPEQVPVQYGGLSREGEQEFTFADPATQVTIKPATKHTVEFHVTETCLLVWEARVVGWDVSYGAEFSPSSEGSYAMILQKTRKVAPTEEPIISGQFQASELGKVVVTIENQSSKRKKLLYRSKTKACSEDQCPC